jgi:hypothetical protein
MMSTQRRLVACANNFGIIADVSSNMECKWTCQSMAGAHLGQVMINQEIWRQKLEVSIGPIIQGEKRWPC